MINKLRITLFALLLACLPLHADEVGSDFQFKPFQAQYQLKKAGLALGIAQFELKAMADNLWRYRSSIQPSGVARLFTQDSFSEASTVLISEGNIVPAGYQYQRTGSKAETARVDYDWDKHRATFTRNGKSKTIAISKQHQDRYSLVLSLMQASAQGQQAMTYPVIDKSMKTRTYKRDGEETITTPLGEQATIRIIQSGSGKRQVHYWLCPALNYIPVRIEQFRKGKSQLTMTLKSLDWQ